MTAHVEKAASKTASTYQKSDDCSNGDHHCCTIRKARLLFKYLRLELLRSLNITRGINSFNLYVIWIDLMETPTYFLDSIIERLGETFFISVDRIFRNRAKIGA